MDDKEWKEYRRQADNGEHPEVTTAAVLSLLNERESLRAEVKRWKAAIEGLTPQGSEYVDDPEACAAAIRHRTQWPKQIIELRTALAASQKEINAAWLAIHRSWDIEPREYFEKEAPKNGFNSPLAMAVHYMWKRETKSEVESPKIETQAEDK